MKPGKQEAPTEATQSVGRLRFEQGVVRKFVLATVAMVVLPLVATYGVYKALVNADALAFISPGMFGWLARVASTDFASQNKGIIGAICGMVVAITIQVVYVVVAISEEVTAQNKAKNEQKQKKNQ